MPTSTRPLAVCALAGVLALTLSGAPGAVRAGNPGPAAVRAPDTGASQSEHAEYWQGRAAAARARLAEAKAGLDAADAAVRRMRRRNHPRGDARAALEEEREEARTALAHSVHHLEVELPDEARAAGADPDWLGQGS